MLEASANSSCLSFSLTQLDTLPSFQMEIPSGDGAAGLGWIDCTGMLPKQIQARLTSSCPCLDRAFTSKLKLVKSLASLSWQMASPFASQRKRSPTLSSCFVENFGCLPQTLRRLPMQVLTWTQSCISCQLQEYPLFIFLRLKYHFSSRYSWTVSEVPKLDQLGLVHKTTREMFLPLCHYRAPG